MKELSNYRDNGITEAELKFMKNSLGQRDARSYETGIQKANFIRRILDYNLPANYIDQQNKILANLTKKEVDAFAKKMLAPVKMNCSGFFQNLDFFSDGRIFLGKKGKIVS